MELVNVAVVVDWIKI